QLGAVTQVKVLAQSIVLPSACFLNAGPPPKTSCSIKIEEPSAPAARGLFEQKVTVQKHRLDPGQQRIAAVKMAPSGLNHADLRIGKKLNGPLKQIPRRNEVRVENTNKLAAGRFQAALQRARLESRAVYPVN